MSITDPRTSTSAAPAGRRAAAADGAPAPGAVAGEPRRRRRPRASAARCLGVGLVCFAVWLMLDANKLYRSAEASPLGSRRTVAIIVLRPFAAVSNAVGLSSLVNGADDALGRANGPGSDQVGQNYDPTLPTTTLEVGAGAFNGLPALPHHLRGLILPHYNPPPPPGPPPIAQPTAAHPLVMLDIGDSIGEDLGFGLGDQFSGDAEVVVHQEAVEDTGLARPDYYDWPGHLETYLQQFHPQVVVAMFGGNDAQNFIQDNKGVVFGTPLWRTDYGERVAQIMDEVTDAGAHLFWVGMPIMQSPGFSAQMQEVDAVYAAEAATHPGVTYFSTWKLFSNSAGQYTEYLSTPQGTIQARDDDGVHLAPAGWDYLASQLVDPMQRAWHISLGS